MFSWFKKEPLVFPDNQAAFAYACKHLKNELLLEAVLPALVVDRGEPGNEGERYFLLRIASRSGGFEHWGCTLKEADDYPAIGDLIGFRIVKIAPDLPEGMNIIGYIACKLAPTLAGKKGWVVEKSYTPENIKQVVRLF
jgi:hypothetical protein